MSSLLVGVLASQGVTTRYYSLLTTHYYTLPSRPSKDDGHDDDEDQADAARRRAGARGAAAERLRGYARSARRGVPGKAQRLCQDG